ncbi:hypothetical protein MMC25_007321 [Agyrium rufum]|nr:hypothetical protein [Agyrium rufum]
MSATRMKSFADNIFGDQYSTIESLLQQPLGDSEEIIPIGFCEEALEVPVLQVCDVNGGTGKPLHYRSLRNPLIELGHRAGAGHISQAARDKLMGHANAAFRQSYVTNTCLLDVQSVVAGRASAEDFGTLLQSMSKHRVINPPRSLPLERMSLLRRQPVLKNIEREEKEAMKDMKQTTASGMGVKKHRNKLDTIRKKKRRFLKRELIKFWNEMKARQQGPHRQNTAHASMIALSLFDIYKRWLPERNTMAQHLFSESFDLWSPTGLIVIRDMMELAGKGRNRAIFNRDEAPVNGKCAMCLKKQYTRIDEFRKHTYKCHADQKSGEAYALFQKAESTNFSPMVRPHPSCELELDSWDATCDHLITIHRLPACTFEIEDESIECKDNPNTLCGLKDGDEVELDNSLNDYLDPAAFDDLSSASTQMIEGNNFQAMEMLETDFLEMDDIQSFCN